MDIIPFLFNHLSDYGHFSCYHILAIVIDAATEHSCKKVLCRPMFSSPLGIYLGIELLGYMVILCSTFWGTPELLFKVAAQFYIPTSSIQRFQFFYLLAATYSLSQNHLLKKTILSPSNSFDITVKNQLTANVRVYFRTLSSIPLTYICLSLLSVISALITRA